MVANLAPRKMKFGIVRRHGARGLGRGPGHLPARAGQRRAAGNARQVSAARRGSTSRSASARVTPAPLALVIAAIVAWLVIGVLGSSVRAHLRFVEPRRCSPPAPSVGLGLRRASRSSRSALPPQSTVLPLGLPDLPFHLRLDALSAFFLLLLGRPRAAISLFSAGYFRSERRHRARAHLPSVPRVPRGDGAGAGRRRRLRCSWSRGRRWRCRRSSSSPPSTAFPRSAAPGFLYLLIAHVGAIAILLCFGVLQGGSGDYTFAGMRAMRLTGAWPSVGVLPRAGRLRRQGRPAAAARLAAGGAPGRALAGVGADERRDAEDRDLRPAARDLRPAAPPALVVGRGRAGAGSRHRAVRRGLRRRADGHEAPARLFVDREHRDHRRRHRPRHPVQRPTARRCSRRSR